MGFLNKEQNFYLWTEGQEKEKLVSEIGELVHVTEDLTTVYYMKEGSLYKQVQGSDKEKIASDVNRVVKVYDSGEVYYTTAENTEISLMDYVVDDKKDADAALTMPQKPDRPYYFQYDTPEEYNAAMERYNTAYEAYQEARDAYREKERRDNLRQRLLSATIEQTQYSLHCWSGGESTLITDALDSVANHASEKPVLILRTFNQNNVSRVMLSETSNLSEVEYLAEEARDSSADYSLLTGTTLTVIEQNKARNFRISEDGSTVYFLDDMVEEKDYGDLYSLSVGEEIGSPELYDTEVYTYGFYFLGNEKLVYFKDLSADSSKGDLYINHELIDSDVQSHQVRYYEDADLVVYYTDWSGERSCGTLKTYSGGESTKISDDVHDFSFTANQQLLYLYDYSSNSYRGTLYLSGTKEPQKISDDAVAIITPSDSRIKGSFSSAGGSSTSSDMFSQ